MKNSLAADGSKIQHTLERGADKATVATHNAINSAADATRPALDHLVANAHEAVDHAGAVATNAATALGVKGDQLNASGQRAADRASGYIQEHPLASLGVAVATGYILSRLFSSR